MWNDVSDNEIYVISPPHVASVDLLIGILVSTFNSFMLFHDVIIYYLISLAVGFRIIYFSMCLLSRFLVKRWKTIIFNTNSSAWIGYAYTILQMYYFVNARSKV